MMEIFKTIGDKLVVMDHFEDGVWVNLVNPTEQDVQKVARGLGLDPDHIKAALDEEERARIEIEDGYTVIIVDIPIADSDGSTFAYTTIPLGIIVAKDSIITVCLRENIILKDFSEGRVKTFYTYKKTRFILQILYRNAAKYLQYLRLIDKESTRIASKLQKSTKNQELIQLLDLEKGLVYFSTSLKANEIVLEKMLRTESVKNYPEDTELLEDVIVENKQAIEMAKIYSDILTGTMNAFASVISNNLNMVMKLLASLTIVLAIPTMIASFFGMNVPVPMAHNSYAFLIIAIIAVVSATLAALIMAKRKML